jgi:hypothetical protein
MLFALRFFLFGPDFDRHIRAPQLAKHAGIAILLSLHHRFLVIVQFQDLFGAEGDADAAALAKAPVDFNHRSLFLL